MVEEENFSSNLQCLLWHTHVDTHTDKKHKIMTHQKQMRLPSDDSPNPRKGGPVKRVNKLVDTLGKTQLQQHCCLHYY